MKQKSHSEDIKLNSNGNTVGELEEAVHLMNASEAEKWQHRAAEEHKKAARKLSRECVREKERTKASQRSNEKDGEEFVLNQNTNTTPTTILKECGPFT